jgi:serine/threonine-protein kinase
LGEHLLEADGVLREALDLGGPRASARPRILASLGHVAFLRGRREAGAALLVEARQEAEELHRRGLVVALDRMAEAWNSAPAR